MTNTPKHLVDAKRQAWRTADKTEAQVVEALVAQYQAQLDALLRR